MSIENKNKSSLTLEQKAQRSAKTLRSILESVTRYEKANDPFGELHRIVINGLGGRRFAVLCQYALSSEVIPDPMRVKMECAAAEAFGALCRDKAIGPKAVSYVEYLQTALQNPTSKPSEDYAQASKGKEPRVVRAGLGRSPYDGLPVGSYLWADVG